MSPVLTVDVAHPPRRPDAVEDDLLRAVTQVRNSTDLRVLKIVHGYGSSGKGGGTREIVHNWLYRNRSRFRVIIEGREFELTNRVVQEMRTAIGQFPDRDLGGGNPGITVVWVK